MQQPLPHTHMNGLSCKAELLYLRRCLTRASQGKSQPSQVRLEQSVRDQIWSYATAHVARQRRRGGDVMWTPARGQRRYS
jgi:hypothetical protein